MTVPSNSNGPPDPLDTVVANYLQQVEAGTPPDRDALLAAHPDLADRLRTFFADLDAFGDSSAAFRLPDMALPEDFGDYEFVRELGRGGMGVVYLAHQKSANRPVALKMVLDGRLADPSAVRRFRDEAGTVAQLDHPHIVPIFEVGEHRGQPYFTMKLIAGQSLARCLDRYTADPVAAARLLAAVCRAVHHAHQRGVLHRDLKPANVLVDAAGGPHVTDFGLARRVEEARGLTESGVVVGTPEYMAPEQAAGRRDVTTAADVYGLGAILYALLTGRAPFRGETVYHTLRAVIEDDPVPPRRIRREVPRDLDVICRVCLAKEPGRRYASAEAVALDLDRWRRGDPIAARPASRVERLRMWARRRPAAAALLVVSVVSAAIILGGGPVLSWKLWSSNVQLAEANRQIGDKTLLLEATLRDLEKSNTNLADSLWLSRREVFNSQLARVAAVFEREPGRALDLLYDTDACPIDQRDAAWRYYENAARGYHLGSRPGVIVARSSAIGWREGEERPNDAHQGRRWALLRAEDGRDVALFDPITRSIGTTLAPDLTDRPLRVVDVLSGEVRATLPARASARNGYLTNTVISQDGGTVAWIEYAPPEKGGTQVRACDVTTGQVYEWKVDLAAGFSAMVLSPDGRYLFLLPNETMNRKSAGRLVEVRTGNTYRQFDSAQAPLRTPVFSPDGRHLAFWINPKENDYSIVVFDVEARKVLPAITGRQIKEGFFNDLPFYQRLLFTPDSRHLLRFETMFIHYKNEWDQPKDPANRPIYRLSVYAIGSTTPAHTVPLNGGAGDVQFSPDGRLLGVATTQNAITLIDTATWKVRHTLAGASDHFAFRRDGREVFASLRGRLRAWDVETGEGRDVREGDHGVPLGVSERNEMWAIRNTGTSTWTGHDVHAWKLTPRDGGRAITPKDRVTAARFARDGRSLFWIETVQRRTADDSVFDEPWQGEWLFSRQSGDPPFPKGRFINNQWVYDDDTTFRFDLATGQTTRHKGRSPDIPPDDPPPGRHVDERGEEWAFELEGKPRDTAVRTARLTNRRTGDRRVLRFDLPRGSVDLGPTPDGQCVLFGYENGTVEFRDVWTGRVRATLTGHTATVVWAIWAPDGTALATRSENGPIRVWDLGPPAAVGRWQSHGMTFNSDGRSLINLEHVIDSLTVRSLITGQVERLIPWPPEGGLADKGLSVSTDGHYLFATQGGRFHARDLVTGEDHSGPFGRRESLADHTAAAPDGTFVVGLQRHRSGGTDERPEYETRLVRMDLPGGALTKFDQFPNREPGWLKWELRVTADSRQVILVRPAGDSGGGPPNNKPSHILAWYDAHSGDLLRETGLTYTSDAFGKTALTLDPRGYLTLDRGPEHQYRVRDLRTGEEKWRLPPRGHGYPTAAFSPDSQWLAAGDEYGTVWVWDAETGRQAAVFHARSVLSGALHLSIRELCFDPTSRRLAARVGYPGPPPSLPDQVIVWNFTPDSPPAPAGK